MQFHVLYQVLHPSIWNNCKILKAGLYCENGVGAVPDLAVEDQSGHLEYIVIFQRVLMKSHNMTSQMLATCVTSSYICKPTKGCLLVLFTDTSLVVYSVGLDSELVKTMLTFIKSYVQAPKCLTKRSTEQCEKIGRIKAALSKQLSKIATLGTYPIVPSIENSLNEADAVLQPGYMVCSNIRSMRKFVKPNPEKDLPALLDDCRRYMAKQARELIVCNVSDMSGNPSNLPHTILAGSFLSSASLKVVIKCCVDETRNMIEKHPSNAKILNIGCDGESLHLVTRTNEGQPGTLLSLAKHLYDLIKKFKKQDLAWLISRNKKVVISDDTNAVDEDIPDLNDENLLYDSIANVLNETVVKNICSLDDVEIWLTDEDCVDDGSRYLDCKKLKKEDLCIAALKHVLPNVKKQWLCENYGSSSLSIILSKEQIEYSPSTVFEKTDEGFYTTISFDMAHLSNLLREAVAKNRLKEFGLTQKSMLKLSQKEGFAYLKPILSITGSKLDYDPMNQKASALCFSEKTESGLKQLGDLEGSRVCNLLRCGIIEALDKTGVSSEDRVSNIFKLKKFLDELTDPIMRLKRPEKETITNELLQMLHCSLDSHIITFLNMSHFNAHRKYTLTCEQFFGMLTLMADGGRKLYCRQISEILERCTISNALRLTPEMVKGFRFLSLMKVHMTSYSAETEDEGADSMKIDYPTLTEQKRVIIPSDSLQDRIPLKRKRGVVLQGRTLTHPSIQESTSNVRKFHRKF